MRQARSSRLGVHTAAFLLLLTLSGCYALRGTSGGGQASFQPPRSVVAADVAVPPGYRVEVVATGLDFPVGVAFDAEGRTYVLEAGYSYGEVFAVPRLLRLEPGGEPTEIARGANPPWNGLAFHQGAFYVAEGGVLEGGRILRVGLDGGVIPVLEGLPSQGDHHTNGPAVGPDGWIYFGQGSATNSGVVGLDSHAFGWLERFPAMHDTPCRDVVLRGQNFETRDPRREGGAPVTTGAFVPFGTPTHAGQVVPGRLPCSAAIMRVRPDGSGLELVAWGLRNPFGLAFSPDGRLFATDNSYDERGSRPVWGTGDLLFEVVPGSWYGWPDYHGQRPLSEADHFRSPGSAPPGLVMAEHPNLPPRPAAVLGVHSSSNGFDFSRGVSFGHAGEAFIAQFGDMAPGVGKVLSPVGFKVVRVHPGTGVVRDFMVNLGRENGPASRVGGGGLERPVAARFGPAGEALYVVDFGVMLVDERAPRPVLGTGVLWRVVRDAGAGP